MVKNYENAERVENIVGKPGNASKEQFSSFEFLYSTQQNLSICRQQLKGSSDSYFCLLQGRKYCWKKRKCIFYFSHSVFNPLPNHIFQTLPN